VIISYISPGQIGLVIFIFALLLHDFFPEKKTAILAAAALSYRLYFLFFSPLSSAYSINGKLLCDANIFHEQALYIANFPGFFIWESRPFYPALLSVIYTIFGNENYKIMMFIQHLMGTGIVLFVYAIVGKLIKKDWAFLAGLIVACSYYLVEIEASIFTESTGFFFLVFSIYTLVINKDSEKKYTYILAGLSLAYSNMMRPFTVAAVFPLSAYFFFTRKKKLAISFLAAACLLTSLWFVFNYYCFGVATMSKTGIENFWIATNPKQKGFSKAGLGEAYFKKRTSYKEHYNTLAKEIKNNLRHNKADYLKKVKKTFVKALFVDRDKWGRLKFLFVITMLFFFRLMTKDRRNFVRLPFLFLPLLTFNSWLAYHILFFVGIYAAIASRRCKYTCNLLLVLYISLILGISFFGIGGYVRRLSVMTQWIKEIFYIAGFAFIATWVEKGGNIRMCATNTFSPELLHLEQKKGDYLSKVVFSIICVWIITSFILIGRSGFILRRHSDAIKKFEREVRAGKHKKNKWAKKCEVEIKATGEFYRKIIDENELLLQFFKSKKKLRKKLSRFPKLYKWYSDKIYNPNKKAPQVIIGRVQFDTITLNAGLSPNKHPLFDFIYRARPFRRTIFLMNDSVLNHFANYYAQQALPIEESSFWCGEWGRNYWVVLEGGSKSDIRGKRVLVFGERVKSSDAVGWIKYIFMGKFVLNYEPDFKNKTIKLSMGTPPLS